MDDLSKTDVLSAIAERITKVTENSFANTSVACGDRIIVLGLRAVNNADTPTLSEARERNPCANAGSIAERKNLKTCSSRAYVTVLDQQTAAGVATLFRCTFFDI
jgi:hypothetical protein